MKINKAFRNMWREMAEYLASLGHAADFINKNSTEYVTYYANLPMMTFDASALWKSMVYKELNYVNLKVAMERATKVAQEYDELFFNEEN